MARASTGDDKNTLVEALRRFKCCKDLDVQGFLNHKAIDFEVRGWATTYLLLSRERFDSGDLFVEGYFALTHKAVIFDSKVSLSSRKKIAGTKTAETESFVLIGQLGKRIGCTSDGTTVCSSLTAVDLLNDAMSIIEQSSNYIISRNVIVECKPIEKIKHIYEHYGFADLQYDEQEALHTLYLRVENKITF